MLALKKINNNFALCKDNSGTTLIAYGKGIGFGQFPCEVPLGRIDATYYNVEPQLMSMLGNLPDDIFRVSRDVVRYAQEISKKPIPNNFVFSLGDHIQFAIDRQKKNIPVKMPFVYEIEHLYETEYNIGKYALRQIQRELHIRLPKDEIIGIALHFINNYQQYSASEDALEFDALLEKVLQIIETQMNLHIDRGSYDCYRFSQHLRYFMKRADEEALYPDGNDHTLYDDMRRMHPEAYQCMKVVQECLEQELTIECSEEEQLYLLIHISRLCMKEDCHR